VTLSLVQPVPDGPPRCARCGDVIGVYEVLVHVVNRRPEKTSRAAQAGLTQGSPGLFYHFVCYGLEHPPCARRTSAAT
jgi:hypothetical protein